MADLRVGIVVSAIDRITRPMRGIAASTGRTAASLKNFETQRAGVKSLAGLQSRLGSTAQKMHAAKLRTAELGRQLSATANPTKKLRQQFESSRKASDELGRSHREQKQEIGRLGSSLRDAGVDTRRLSREPGPTRRSGREAQPEDCPPAGGAQAVGQVQEPLARIGPPGRGRGRSARCGDRGVPQDLCEDGIGF